MKFRLPVPSRWKQAPDLERVLLRQAEEQQMVSVEDEAETRRIEMKAEFEWILSVLRSAGVGLGFRPAAYRLPWCLVMGPPASGKSTLLRSSQLRFQTQSRAEPEKPTRLFQAWLSNEGVVLDTEGGWATDTGRTVDWHWFLRLLRNRRRWRAVDAIAFVIPAATLASLDVEARMELARQLRQRCDDVAKSLGVSAPIHLLVSRIDELLGADRPAFGADRFGQPWGFVLPGELTLPDCIRRAEESLDRLTSDLGSWALSCVEDASSVETRRELLSLPHRCDSVSRGLVEFLREFGRPNVYHEEPCVRSVHFVSPTEHALDCGPAFRRIFRDVRCVVPSRSRVRRRERKGWIAAAVLFMVGWVATAWPAVAWVERRGLLQTAYDTAERSVASSAAGNLGSLRALREVVRRLNSSDGGLLVGALERGSGARVSAAARATYGRALWRDAVSPLVRRDLAALEDFAERYGGASAPVVPSEVYDHTVERLRSVLLLSDSKGTALDWSRVPSLSDEGQSQWISDRLYREWRTHNSSAGDDDISARESITAYVGLVASGVAKPPEIDPTSSDECEPAFVARGVIEAPSSIR